MSWKLLKGLVGRKALVRLRDVWSYSNADNLVPSSDLRNDRGNIFFLCCFRHLWFLSLGYFSLILLWLYFPLELAFEIVENLLWKFPFLSLSFFLRSLSLQQDMNVTVYIISRHLTIRWFSMHLDASFFLYRILFFSLWLLGTF